MAALHGKMPHVCFSVLLFCNVRYGIGNTHTQLKNKSSKQAIKEIL